MSKRLSTLAQILEPGIAPSLAKAYVQRLAAVKEPTPAKNKIPRIKKSKPKPPPEDPVACIRGVSDIQNIKCYDLLQLNPTGLGPNSLPS